MPKRTGVVPNRIFEMANRLPEVRNRIPEVRSRISEVWKRIPEVTSLTPEASNRLLDVPNRIPHVPSRALPERTRCGAVRTRSPARRDRTAPDSFVPAPNSTDRQGCAPGAAQYPFDRPQSGFMQRTQARARPEMPRCDLVETRCRGNIGRSPARESQFRSELGQCKPTGADGADRKAGRGRVTVESFQCVAGSFILAHGQSRF